MTRIPETREPKLSTPMLKALRLAALRDRGNICPIPGVYGNAESVLIEALDLHGFIDWDGGSSNRGAPRISAAARAAIAKAEGRS